MAAGLGALALAVAAALWAPWRADDGPQAAGPALIVVPFEGLSGGEGGQLLANGLTNGLVTDLMRFDALQVFAAAPGGDGGAPLPAAAAGAPAYVVTGGVEREAGRVRVTARLTDRASGEVVWSQRYDRALTTADILDVEDELAAGIAGRLAQVYGVVNTAAVRRPSRTRPATLFAYDCVQQAFAYRRTFARSCTRRCAPASRRRCAATPATPAPGPCWPSPTWTPPGSGWSSRRRAPASWTPGWRRRGGPSSWRPRVSAACSRWRRCSTRGATSRRPSACSGGRSR